MKRILVVGGHAWKDGDPEPLLTAARRTFEGMPGVEVVGVPYQGIASGKGLLGMLKPITAAIKDARRSGREVILCGNSAGGHLAVCAAKLHPSDVSAVISIAGALDFSQVPLIAKPLGLIGRSFSPIVWAKGFKVPILLLHGTCDPVVLMKSSANFYARCGSENKRVEYAAGLGHDVEVLVSLADAARQFVNGIGGLKK